MWRRMLSLDLESFQSICDESARGEPKSSRYLRCLNCVCIAIVVVVPIYQKLNLVGTVSAASSSLSPWSICRLNKRCPTLLFPFLPEHKGNKSSSRLHQQLQRSASQRRTKLTKTGDSCNMKNNNAKIPARHKKEDHVNSWWTHSGFYYGIGEELLKRHSHQKWNNSTFFPKRRDTLPEMETTMRQRTKPKRDVQHDKQIVTNSIKQDPTKGHIDVPYSPFIHDKDLRNEEYYSSYSEEQQQLPETFATILRDAVQEFRKATDNIRDDLASLRLEIKELQRLQGQNGYLPPQTDGVDEQRYYDQVNDDYEDEADKYSEDEASSHIAESRRRAAVYDRLALQIEHWAKKLIREGGREEFGWKAVECNKLFKSKYDADGQTKVYLKWMTDPRYDEPTLKTQRQSSSTSQQVIDALESTSKSSHKNKKKEILFPCIKCVGTIDAPIETVCEYLSDESRVPEYNDLVADFRDLEEISVNSKITWTLCPPVLFIKSRDFVTFCSHRWKRDGTQVVVNQALEHHKDAPQALEKESDGGACRARALRGANLISPHPDDPLEKTCFTFLALADPGGDLPPWAMKAAVNAVAPIEPFKLYYKLRTALKSYKPTITHTKLLLSTSKEDSVASTSAAGRSSKPAGLAQLGYACFWPKGGGLQEHHSSGAYRVNSSYLDTPETNMDPVLNDSNLKERDR